MKELSDKSEAHIERADKNPFQSIQDVMIARMHKIENLSNKKLFPSGLTTGIRDLDNITNGIETGEVWSLVAVPGMGKFSFLCSMLAHWLSKEDQPRVYTFLGLNSLENLGLGLLSAYTKIDKFRLRSGNLRAEDWTVLAQAADKIAKSTFFSRECGIIKVDELIDDLKRVNPQGPFLLVIDSLNALAYPGSKLTDYSDRAMELDRCLFELKGFLKERKGSMLVMHSLSCDTVENRLNRRPWYTDLKGVGNALRTHSDVMMGLYRYEVYEKQCEDVGEAEIILMKNSKREGDTIRAHFTPECGLFSNLNS
jgi:replicative DNA helicase